jgi:large subunit ribosomal protein L3
MKAIYGLKVGMTRVNTEAGANVPVTVLEVAPNVIYQVKTVESDGYNAVQVGLKTQKAQRVNRALTGHFSKAKRGLPKFVSEIQLDEKQMIKPADEQGEARPLVAGDELTVAGLFEVGSKVDVVGTTTGKGFAGVMKRHGMKGAQTNTHGTHEYFRHGGSIGCRKFPGRVFKNKRMGGHMGTVQITQRKLEVVGVRPEDNLLLLKGSVPGTKGEMIFIKQSAV